MAVGFVSLWLSVALSYFNLVRAFATRRVQPHCCILAATFLQRFINKLVQLALASGVSLANVIKLPANMAADFGRGPVPEESALHPLAVSSTGLFDFTLILACPDGECVKAAWSHDAVGVDALASASSNGPDGSHGPDPASSRGLAPDEKLQLNTSTMEHAQLGDVVAFWLLTLQGHARGAYVGGAFFVLQQLGLWLRCTMDQICDFADLETLPELNGLGLGPGPGPASARAAGPAPDDAQALTAGHGLRSRELQVAASVFAYCSKVSTTLAQADTKTKTFVTDGWRGKGEGLEIYFVYSPALAMGGYLPYQVPLRACDFCSL